MRQIMLVASLFMFYKTTREATKLRLLINRIDSIWCVCSSHPPHGPLLGRCRVVWSWLFACARLMEGVRRGQSLPALTAIGWSTWPVMGHVFGGSLNRNRLVSHRWSLQHIHQLSHVVIRSLSALRTRTDAGLTLYRRNEEYATVKCKVF